MTSLGRVVVLEVDGAFHLDTDNWMDDMGRERAIVTTGPVVLRCSTWEVRETEQLIAECLRANGVLPLAA